MRPETIPQELLEAAANWHDRLNRGDVSQETEGAFAAWIAQSDDCRVAYESVRRTWQRVQSAAAHPQILALRHETALRLTRRTSAATRSWRWAAAAVVLIALFGTAAMFGDRFRSNHPIISAPHDATSGQDTSRYETAIGERLSATLADGSQVTLDTQSELTVTFTASERIVRLLRGQVYLKVAKNRERPFVVEVLQRRIIAVGTAFDVRVDGAQLRVTMTEGAVRVEHRGAPADSGKNTPAMPPPTVSLAAGEELVSNETLPDLIRVSNPERSTSWLSGQIVFDNTPLADAVAELNRYSSTKIELADPKIAQLHLSGTFASGRPALFIEAVTNYFPVRISRADDQLVILDSKR